jgi:mannose-6-phosphate isomerase-like protein (cupin superfamily)
VFCDCQKPNWLLLPEAASPCLRVSSAQPIVATIPASPRNLWPRTEGTNEISTALPTIPADNPKRNLTLAQRDNLPHIGLVGDTYTITVTGEETDGRLCVIDMHIPPGGGPPPHRHDFEETFILLEGEMEATFRGKKSIVRAGGDQRLGCRLERSASG